MEKVRPFKNVNSGQKVFIQNLNRAVNGDNPSRGQKVLDKFRRAAIVKAEYYRYKQGRIGQKAYKGPQPGQNIRMKEKRDNRIQEVKRKREKQSQAAGGKNFNAPLKNIAQPKSESA